MFYLIKKVGEKGEYSPPPAYRLCGSPPSLLGKMVEKVPDVFQRSNIVMLSLLERDSSGGFTI